MTAKKPPTHRDICGTRKGWNAHNRHNETQCGPCTEANNSYMHDWRLRTGRTTSKLYSNHEIAMIKAEAKAQALREAADAYPLETAYGGAEHAILWLKERATEIEETS